MGSLERFVLLESVKEQAGTQVTSQALVPSVRGFQEPSRPSGPNIAEPGFPGTWILAHGQRWRGQVLWRAWACSGGPARLLLTHILCFSIVALGHGTATAHRS